MKVIKVRNVNEALAEGLFYLDESGHRSTSRNGPVIVSPCPVMTVYENPFERVLFSPMRDANPFFHFMEALWMLAGRRDLAWPLYFNKRFGEYSDDGVKVHGAYGYRWREWFGYDQLKTLSHELQNNPSTRRAVLSMWDGGEFSYAGNKNDYGEDGDLFKAIQGGKDVPCNTHAYFLINEGKLDMTVCCRSNDILWGAYGANAVHFSMLLEYMAALIGVVQGKYYQFSNNFHAYPDVVPVEKFIELSHDAAQNDLYNDEGVRHFRMVNVPLDLWWTDLNTFLDDPLNTLALCDPFFGHVAAPMYLAYKTRKEKQGDGMKYAEMIVAHDWRVACMAWIKRREAAKEQEVKVTSEAGNGFDV